MPLVEVTLIEGRSDRQLRDLITKLTAAVETAVSAPKDTIRVIIREVPATHWAGGDKTIAEARAERFSRGPGGGEVSGQA